MSLLEHPMISLISNSCKLYGYASSVTDATTSSNAGLYVSGRLCSNEGTCTIRACESCALMGATMERGCRYDSGSHLQDAQGTEIIILVDDAIITYQRNCYVIDQNEDLQKVFR